MLQQLLIGSGMGEQKAPGFHLIFFIRSLNFLFLLCIYSILNMYMKNFVWYVDPNFHSDFIFLVFCWISF